jgi:hypothetical protein
MATRGTYYLSIHPTGEPAAWIATATFYAAALGAMHGIARISVNVAGGWVLVWDAAKPGAPIAGSQFGDLYWFPDQPVELIEEGTTAKIAGDLTELWEPPGASPAGKDWYRNDLPPLPNLGAVWASQGQDAVGGTGDWFKDFVQRWASNWWRR